MSLLRLVAVSIVHQCRLMEFSQLRDAFSGRSTYSQSCVSSAHPTTMRTLNEFGPLSLRRLERPRRLPRGEFHRAHQIDQEKRGHAIVPWPISCEGRKPPEGNSCCAELGGEAAICISCYRYDRFLTNWKTFFVQCSHANVDTCSKPRRYLRAVPPLVVPFR